MSLKDQIVAYIASGSTLQDALRVYVTDKSIPLQDRWETFLAAPSDWRTSERRSTDLPLNSLNGVLSSPYDDFHMEYGSSQDVEELFDNIDQLLADGFEDLTQEMIDAGKEEAMAMNLGRWEYNN